MKIVPFSERKISTITMIVEIAPVDFHSVFWFLPWKNCPDFLEESSENKKSPPRISSSPGSIACLKMMRKVRGIGKKTTKKKSEKKAISFQHSCTINLFSGEKFLSLKVCKDKIHITGAKSIENGLEGARLLLEQVRQAELFRQTLTQEICNQFWLWFRDHARGDQIVRHRINSEGIEEQLIDFTIKRNIEPPPDLPKNLFDFLWSYARDEEYLTDFLDIIYYLPQNSPLYQVEPKLLDYEVSMCNYNYKLDFNVNLSSIREVFNEVGEFYAQYDGDSQDGTKIQLPYQRIGATLTKKKNRKPRHTFTVYASGSVTQSGPGGSLAESAYYRFMNIISQYLKDVSIVI